MYDAFLSYAHADATAVLALRSALEERGLRVWIDDRDIADFASISGRIDRDLAASKVLVAYYSLAYPTRRACQYELTEAFLAAARLGDPRDRVLVVNPEPAADHIQPLQLRDARHATSAAAIAEHVAGLDGVLGAARPAGPPTWYGAKPVFVPRFVGRLPDMWSLHSALHADEAPIVTHVSGAALAQVTGLPGAGKSLLVGEYARRYASAFAGGVFWLNASGGKGAERSAGDRAVDLDRQLRELANGVGLDARDLPAGDVRSRLALALDERAQPFLWVVDDVPSGLDHDDLVAWLSPSKHGKTVLTTRSREYVAVGAELHVGVLTEAEGIELLTRHREPSDAAERAAAEAIVAELGWHALAIDVAGAALRALRGMRSFAEYAEDLANPTGDELERAAAYRGMLPNGHEKSIAGTFERSIGLLDADGIDFLSLASLVATYEPIPVDLVVATLARVGGLSDEQARERAARAMDEAEALSLVESGDEDGRRRVHALVSWAMRLREREPGRIEAIADAAIAALTDGLRDVSDHGDRADSPTLAHARHLASPARTESRAELLDRVAWHDARRGSFASARDEWKELLAVRRERQGPEHRDTFRTAHDLAAMLRETGDLAASRALLEATLEAMTSRLGSDHPDTLSIRDNLSLTLSQLGDVDAAQEAAERVMELRAEGRGDDDPATVAATSNVAALRFERGDVGGALALLDGVVASMRARYGEEHEFTITAMNNLAHCLRRAGDVGDAHALHERVLALSVRVLGEEHPGTLIARSGVAFALHDLGDLEGARDVLEQVVEQTRAVRGDRHRETLKAEHNLAWLIYETGDAGEALERLNEVVKAQSATLGDEHPDTQQTIRNLNAIMSELLGF